MNMTIESIATPVERQGSSTIAEYLTDAFVLPDSTTIPDAIIDRANWCFVDTLGVALAAAGLGIGTAASKVVLKAPGGSSTVWGSGKGVSMTDAAFANGMLSHALDFDDTHTAAIMHTSCMVVPVALAIGQATGQSGREVLGAAVTGYEVAGRLGRLGPGDFQYNGFQATGVLGVFACAATAGKLLALDRDQMINAFGIAGSMAGGLMEYLANGSDVKQLHAGWSAQAGIRAAQLAVEGFTGPSTVFEGRFGVFNSFIRKSIDAEAAIRFSPGGWEVELMGPKPYPACLCVHPLVQAVLDIKEQLSRQGGALDDIQNIHCYVPEWYVNLVFEPAASKAIPSTSYEARFSGPYCIARALLDGTVAISSFTTKAIQDHDAAKYASRVTYEVEALPEFPDSFPARVVVKLASGETLESYVHHNLGSPGNPMSPVQYEEKFLTAVRGFLSPNSAQALLAAIRRLAEPDGMKELSNTLRCLQLKG